MKNDKLSFLETLGALASLAASVPMALALSAAARVASIVVSKRERVTVASEEHIRERAARRADAAAKRAAREERKQLRRLARGPAYPRHAFPVPDIGDALLALRAAQGRLRAAKKSEGREWLWASDFSHHHEYVADVRAMVRDAELRYAIACAAAGAVPK